MQTMKEAKTRCLWKYGDCLDRVDIPIQVIRMDKLRMSWLKLLSCFKDVDGKGVRSTFMYNGARYDSNLCYGEVKDFAIGWNYIPEFTLPSGLIQL